MSSRPFQYFLAASVLLLVPVFVDAASGFRVYINNSDNLLIQSDQGLVDLDYYEEFSIQLLNRTSQAPDTPQPIGLAKSIVVSVGNSTQQITRDLSISRSSSDVRVLIRLSDLVSGTDIRPTSNQLPSLVITIRVTMWASSDTLIPDELKGLAKSGLDDHETVATFRVIARSYGPHLLVNLNPLQGNFTAATYDSLLGILNTLQLASVDWPLVYNLTTNSGSISPSFLMLSAPVFYFETRQWYRNLLLEGVVAKDLASGQTSTGIGLAVGLVRTQALGSLFKIGYILLRDSNENCIFLGVSLPALVALSNTN